MAHDLLLGHLPYTLTFDNKPPGIYVIYAAAFVLMGERVLAIRVISCVAIALGAYASYRLARTAVPDRRSVALASAYGYVLYTSHLSGLEANTEIFFMPLVLAAFALLWPDPKRIGKAFAVRYFTIGALFGCALTIKPSVIYDMCSAALVLAFFGDGRRRLEKAAAAVAGAAIPLCIMCWPFVSAFQLDALKRALFAANVRRLGLGISAGAAARQIARDMVALFPLPEIAMLAPFYLRFTPPRARVCIARSSAR